MLPPLPPSLAPLFNPPGTLRQDWTRLGKAPPQGIERGLQTLSFYFHLLHRKWEVLGYLLIIFVRHYLWGGIREGLVKSPSSWCVWATKAVNSRVAGRLPPPARGVSLKAGHVLRKGQISYFFPYGHAFKPTYIGDVGPPST